MGVLAGDGGEAEVDETMVILGAEAQPPAVDVDGVSRRERGRVDGVGVCMTDSVCRRWTDEAEGAVQYQCQALL